MGPLHEAAYNADLELTERLLSAGVAADARDEAGYTPLLWSCLRGRVGDQLPVVSALLTAGADPNAITGSGDANCLILAAQCGSVELLRKLVAAGADLDAVVDDVTPLMQAARSGDDDMVEAMITLGVDIGLIANGFDASDYARHAGHTRLASRLSANSN